MPQRGKSRQKNRLVCGKLMTKKFLTQFTPIKKKKKKLLFYEAQTASVCWPLAA